MLAMQWQTMGKIVCAAALAATIIAAPPRTTAQQGSGTVLKAADAQKLLPASVYYAGQSATTQLRNSGGVRFADGHYVLATLVDTSGYSTGIAAKYQGYFIAEVPLQLGGQSLPAGVYGIGFIADDKFVVTDVGAHDVLTVSTSNDAAMKRPTPLQVQADPSGGFRLYAGRRYVSFTR
jgi:hypothetical protein